MTPEREKQIREIGSRTSIKEEIPIKVRDELLLVIDSLKSQLKLKNETQITGYCLRCESISTSFEALEKERDQLRERVKALREAITNGSTGGVFWREEALARDDAYEAQK